MFLWDATQVAELYVGCIPLHHHKQITKLTQFSHKLMADRLKTVTHQQVLMFLNKKVKKLRLLVHLICITLCNQNQSTFGGMSALLDKCSDLIGQICVFGFKKSSLI